MRLLFIGGPADGKRIDVPEDCDLWNIAEPFGLSFKEFVDIEDLVLRKCTYKKMPFRGNERKFNIMAVEGTTPDKLIEILIQRYRKADADKTKLLVDPKKLDAENLLNRMAEIDI